MNKRKLLPHERITLELTGAEAGYISVLLSTRFSYLCSAAEKLGNRVPAALNIEASSLNEVMKKITDSVDKLFAKDGAVQ